MSILTCCLAAQCIKINQSINQADLNCLLFSDLIKVRPGINTSGKKQKIQWTPLMREQILFLITMWQLGQWLLPIVKGLNGTGIVV